VTVSRSTLPERAPRTERPISRAPALAIASSAADKGNRLEGLGNAAIGAAARANPTAVLSIAAPTSNVSNAAAAVSSRVQETRASKANAHDEKAHHQTHTPAASGRSASPGISAPAETAKAPLGRTTAVTKPSDDIAALSALPPSAMAHGLDTARQAGANAFTQMHQDLVNTPPSMARSSGLPRKPAAAKPTVAAPPPPLPAKHEVPRSAQPVPPIDPVPPLAPLPAAAIDPAELDRVPDDQPDDVALLAANMLGSVPAADETVDTSAGDRPKVHLDADADPAHMSDYEASQRAAADAAWTGAHSGMSEYEGEDDIYPTVPRERLTAHVRAATQRISGRRAKAAVLDRPEVAAAVDGAAAAHWAECTAKAQQDDAAAWQRKESDEQAKRDATAVQIVGAEQAAVNEQTGQQARARQDVAAARQAWNDELAAADQTYSNKASTLRQSHQAQIDKTRQYADDQAKRELDKAEADAEAKKKEKVAEAEAKKREGEKESGGFWGWVKSKAKAFINAIRSAINAIFDGLRRFVKFVIDRAKKFAVWVIEQARRAIVGIIHAFGEALELAADVFLAAFPKARDKAKAWIRRGVNAAEHAVNAAADRLKRNLCELLDALGAALDFILELYQKACNLILDAVEFVVVGLIEIIEGIARLAESAGMVGDHVLGQVEEQGLGVDLTQPLAIEKPEGESDLATAAKGAVASGAISASDAALLGRSSLNNSDVIVEPVAELHLEPELLATVLPEVASGDYHFGQNEAAPGDRDAVLHGALASQTDAAETEGGSPALAPSTVGNADPAQTTPEQQLAYLEAQDTLHTCHEEKSEGPATQEALPANMRIYGRFTAGQRFRYMWGQIKKGISQWWSCNWGKVVAAFAVGVLVALLLGILTGGAIFAAIPPLIEIIGSLLVGVALVRATSYIGDYLSLAWKGDVVGGAKALARAFALLLIELVFALLFNAGAVIKALKSGLKGTAKAATGAVKGAIKGTLKAAGKFIHAVGGAAKAAVKNSKLIITGFREGFGEGIRTIGQLTRELLEKVHFRGFFFRFRGLFLELWGRFNPDALLARVKITKEQAERWFKAIAKAGEKIVPEGRVEAEALNKALVKAVGEEGGELSKRLRDRVRSFFSKFKSQHLEENPVLAEAWKRAVGKLQKGSTYGEFFKDGELVAGVPAETMKKMYAAARGNVDDALKDVLLDLERQFEQGLTNRVAKLPENVQIHHLVYKSIAPELALERANLILALRKTGGSADELHDLFHLISAAGEGNRWRHLNKEIEEIIRDLYEL
jgi:hypothetical protein